MEIEFQGITVHVGVVELAILFMGQGRQCWKQLMVLRMTQMVRSIISELSLGKCAESWEYSKWDCFLKFTAV